MAAYRTAPNRLKKLIRRNSPIGFQEFRTPPMGAAITTVPLAENIESLESFLVLSDQRADLLIPHSWKNRFFSISLPQHVQFSAGRRANISRYGPGLARSSIALTCSGFALCFPLEHSSQDIRELSLNRLALPRMAVISISWEHRQ